MAMKTLLRFYLFLLRPTSSYCVHPIFQGRSMNLTVCDRDIIKQYIDELNEKRPLDFNSRRIIPELSIEQNRFLLFFL